jgi:tetratricopeptide (TPR) repeat protein
MCAAAALARMAGQFVVVLLAFGVSSGFAQAQGVAQNKHSVFHVYNDTPNTTVSYSVRWGPNQNWSDTFTVEPGKSRWHSWAWAQANENDAPVPEIRFNKTIGGGQTIYTLDPNPSPDKDKGGRNYAFELRKNDAGNDYVDLFTNEKRDQVNAQVSSPNRHSVFHIHNDTASTTINYSVRWGPNGTWKPYAVEAGKSNWHSWGWEKANVNNAPVPEVRFNKNIGTGQTMQVYNVNPIPSPDKDRGGKNYAFELRKNDAGANYIDLFTSEKRDKAANKTMVIADETKSKADELWKQGRKAFDEFKNQEAVNLFTKAIEIDSVHLQSYVTRAFAYYNLGKMDLAMQDCTTAIRINGSSPDPYRVRGLIYSARNTDTDMDLAMRDWMKAIDLEPTFGWPYMDKARMHFDRAEYDKAVADYGKAAKVFKRNWEIAEACNSRGLCYFVLEKLDKAIEDYDKAIQLNPKWAAPYSNRAAARYQQNKLDRAIEDCNKAIQIEPRTAAAYRWRSQTYGRMGKIDLAKEDYALAVALDSRQRDLFVNTSFLVDIKEAFGVLESFRLGSTLTPEELFKTNSLDKWEPIGGESMTMSASTKSFLVGEQGRYEKLEFEMVAAADLLFRAAKMSQRELERNQLKLGWLFGPASSPLDRSRSKDGLGGLRIIGRLDLPNGKQINSIFALTYYRAPLASDDDDGKVGLLSNADNMRLAIQLNSTGDPKKDYAFQSFAVEVTNRQVKVRPGFYVDTKTGAQTHQDIIWTAHSTNCIQCHARGSRLDEDALTLMTSGDFAKMEGLPKFLGQMETLGAGKLYQKKIESVMLQAGPTGLLPLDRMLAANRDNWIKIYPRFASKAKQQVAGSKWSGREILNGFGKLAFELQTDGKAIMTDAKNTINGTWTNQDRKVTLTFSDCIYDAVVDGPTLYGTGQFTEKGQPTKRKGDPWTFALVRQ